MADPFGFLKYPRVENPTRPVAERIEDWQELQTPLPENERQEQAARCMNCGIPFCHTGSLEPIVTGKQIGRASCRERV